MTKSEICPNLVVKVTNPILSKHKKFLNMIGKVRSITDIDGSDLDVIVTAFVDFKYNNKCSFEFLLEELEPASEKEADEYYPKPEPEPEEVFEGHKFHKATQDELKANDVPIIPDGTGSNKICSFRWDSDNGCTYPWIQYADKGNCAFVKDYLLGNIFRIVKLGDPELGFNRERATYHRIYSMYDKQVDWATIERKVYNNYRRTVYDKAREATLAPEWNIGKKSSGWKSMLGNTRHILKSKYAKNRWYYRFSICGNKFCIKKVIFPIDQDSDIIFERASFDYAMGNFFISKKDAKRSIAFQKLKTFFKYDDGLSNK